VSPRRRRLFSMTGATVLVAAAAVVAGCGAATPGSLTADQLPVAGTIPLAATASASASATPSAVSSTAPSATPSATPSDPYVQTNPPAKPGGSAIKVVGPCNGGTDALKAYPQGKGVAITATLDHVSRTKWAYNTFITPADTSDQDGDTVWPVRRTHHGRLVIKASNLKGREAVTGHSRAWPQGASADISSTDDHRHGGRHVDCDAAVYMNAQEVMGYAGGGFLQIAELDRTKGTLKVEDIVPKGGVWRVDVTVVAPHGVQHRIEHVKVHKDPTIGIGGYDIYATVVGLEHLQKFTTLTLTVSRGGKHREWVKLTRTP
jgi:hypothetical protein